MKSTKLLRLPAVKLATGLSKSTIYAIEARGEFPHRVVLSQRAVAWRENEIFAWINARARKEEAA
jgi:prophage regulatory protein